MESDRFAALSKRLAGRVSRLTTQHGGATAVAASRARAQGATPTGKPPAKADTIHPNAGVSEKSEFLFTQTFDAGTWAQKAGAKDVFTLTLSGASAETAYFSDRPQRIVGLSPTQKFLAGLGFAATNPPNAALVATPAGGGDQDVLVIELFNPVYDAKTKTLIYDAKILHNYEGTGIAHLAQQQTDFAVDGSFGQGGLFIDGCADGTATCFNITSNEPVGLIFHLGCCFTPGTPSCVPCQEPFAYDGKLCHEAYPDQCSYQTTAHGVKFGCMITDACCTPNQCPQ